MGTPFYQDLRRRPRRHPSVLDSRVRAGPGCLGMPGLAIGSLRTTNNSLLILSLEYIPVRKKLSIISQEAEALASNL